jgi:CheY-like chemotaxis protein
MFIARAARRDKMFVGFPNTQRYSLPSAEVLSYRHQRTLVVRTQTRTHRLEGELVRRSPATRPLVVLVEDCALTRDALATLLELEGYDVSSCGSGAALLTSVPFTRKPAVIVLDLALPDTTGGRCLSAIRSSVWADVPVLIFSGWDHLERFGEGAERCLPKTCDPETIARTIDRLVGRPATPFEAARVASPRRRGRRRSMVAQGRA